LFLLSDFIIFVGIKLIKMEKNSIETDKKFMRFAIEEARRALKEQEVPIGAVVVCGDRVIGRGHNLV
jgi:tRNA(Arg) A34 adenosine deaminase TadA